MLIGPLGTNFSEILIEKFIYFLSVNCIWQCLLENGNFVGLNVLREMILCYIGTALCYNRTVLSKENYNVLAVIVMRRFVVHNAVAKNSFKNIFIWPINGNRNVEMCAPCLSHMYLFKIEMWYSKLRATVWIVQVLPFLNNINHFLNVIIQNSIQSNAFDNIHVEVCHAITHLWPTHRQTRLLKFELPV